MAKIVAVTSCPTGIAHTIMAAEGLEQAAKKLGHEIQVETQGSVGARNTLSDETIAAADVVIIAADTRVDTARFLGKPLHETATEPAIRDGVRVIETALASVGAVSAAALPTSHLKIVGITSCPTGIAHTFMAAEGLEQGAASLGHAAKIETQGSVGAKNTLTAEDIAAADLVIIAADTQVDKTRFAGKRLYEASTKAAIHDGAALVRKAISEATVAGAATTAKLTPEQQLQQVKAQQAAARTGVYKHLMTGVSYMLPFVVAGGLLIAISFALGGINVYDDAHKGTLGWTLFQIGAKSGFALMVPILAGFIAYSIADRPGIAPGMIGGMIAGAIGSGFLGGIAAGFLAGYVVKFLSDNIPMPRTLAGLKPVLILPLLGTTIVGLLMYYVVGEPVAAVLGAITQWLKGMQGTNAAFLGLLLGSMMAFDMGGPVNKAAYAFATGLITSQTDPIYGPMAAVMAAGMTPPLGLALAALLFKDRFSLDEREAAGATAALGISFITEGAIPYAAKDPLRVIPALMIGSALTGAISMVFGCELKVPHGGVFVLPIPNAVVNLMPYLIAIVVGTVATTAALFFLKKPLEVKTPAIAAH
ncbi:fused fructose-specific PTS enzymes: IIBcomponent; IIC components [Candidatus Competibacter denitrificans Run_A_D11]|uniref:protein-N(pi)-phosphohistidine--D-fructose phosphotransferase n=1 Tax=Candidatus Competibacter denitrificans Run_A_D11 TaxID=1400863 RepID=W6MAF0_9GAMM|nr:PTS fructose-like transporter subunit IIB [Candidatus Competibacter denitrificans]CDI02910.1 fused fructose-specific PTS enzymes: IIBcomponent; IIC components [Candidatus Competibacter denitrificans Run_A_D11]HCK81727.1 PTS fructose-like transporter subunit IIB [Candidatus Competibacteraceae bacterium]HRC68664.1 PTS fructose-like transporter subunit IIB [Candidatus Competibacter denitrificans]